MFCALLTEPLFENFGGRRTGTAPAGNAKTSRQRQVTCGDETGQCRRTAGMAHTGRQRPAIRQRQGPSGNAREVPSGNARRHPATPHAIWALPMYHMTPETPGSNLGRPKTRFSTLNGPKTLETHRKLRRNASFGRKTAIKTCLKLFCRWSKTADRQYEDCTSQGSS